MILPIYAYGHPVLRQKTKPVSASSDELKTLIDNMYETMYNASGVGLAAPQIGRTLRLFIVDTIQLSKGKDQGIKKAFINAEMLDESGEIWDYEEGCLSIPDINGDVSRPPEITIKYLDENFEQREEQFSGMDARVIQHEYDHIEGILFTDLLKPLKKKRIKKKLDKIKQGKIELRYPMVFPRF